MWQGEKPVPFLNHLLLVSSFLFVTQSTVNNMSDSRLNRMVLGHTYLNLHLIVQDMLLTMEK